MTFMNLENPDHAYLFGFLQADGHLFRGRGQKGRLTVELNARDIELLERFKALCPYPSSVTTRTRATNFSPESRTAVWSVCALAFRRELVCLGLPEGRKSARIAPPGIPFSARDYLRGLIDADGSLGMTAKGNPFVSLVTQSDALAEYFCESVRQLTGVVHRPRRNRRDSVFNLYYERSRPSSCRTASTKPPACHSAASRRSRSVCRPGPDRRE
ncbi:LAGLIDADG family homing endonuclease [Streptacidiphilus monticola]